MILLSDNFKIFNELIKKLLNNNNEYKNTTKYSNEINIFLKYVEEYDIKDRVFSLEKSDIDNYFIYCQENNKLGAKRTLDTHISALKCIFQFINDNKYKCTDLIGYINTQTFKKEISDKLKNTESKAILSNEDIIDILSRLDNYISKTSYEKLMKVNEKKRYTRILFVRLYIKINLLIPLKVSDMLDLTFKCFDNNFKILIYNDVKIKIPNSLKINIEDTMQFIKKVFGTNTIYTSETKFFKFFTDLIHKDVTTGNVSHCFYQAFDEIGLKKLIPNRPKNPESYPVEQIKKTVISILLNEGTNIIYISKITGLNLDSLILDYSIYNSGQASREINYALVDTPYYSYL